MWLRRTQIYEKNFERLKRKKKKCGGWGTKKKNLASHSPAITHALHRHYAEKEKKCNKNINSPFFSFFSPGGIYLAIFFFQGTFCKHVFVHKKSPSATDDCLAWSAKIRLLKITECEAVELHYSLQAKTNFIDDFISLPVI